VSVEIVIDPYGTFAGADNQALPADTREEYLSACERIDHALAESRDLRVIVRNRAMAPWFDHFRNRRGVRIVQRNPVDMLAQALNVSVSSLPRVLREDPGSIVELKLIDAAKMSKPADGQSIACWILGARMSSPWDTASVSSVLELDELLVQCANGHKSKPAHPALLALQQDVAAQWISSGNFRDVLEWLLAENTRRRAESLIVARLMRSYPHSVQLEALQFEGRWSELCQLKGVEEVLDRLGTFTQSGFALPSGPNDATREYLVKVLEERALAGVLPVLSGFIAEEEKVVSSFLRKNAFRIDSSWVPDLAALRRIFGRNQCAEALIRLISELQPVEEPRSLDARANWGDVSEWLREEYLPYYSWCAATGHIERTTGAASCFEEWLVANYDSLSRSDALLAACLRPRMAKALEDGACLVVVVDGLPASFIEAIVAVAAQNDLRCGDWRLKLATLPTLTEIAKPSLVRGQLPGQFDCPVTSTAAYGELLAASMGLTRDEVVCASSNEASLFDLVREQKMAMLYLYNDIDEAIHKPLPAEKRRERIGQCLSKLVQDLAEACQDYREQSGRQLPVFIVSDHGYTELPRDAGRSLPVPEGLNESHGRVVAGAVERMVSLDDTRVLSADLLGGGTTAYGVARTYNFYGMRPRGATHGGLTPQEVAVPFVEIVGAGKVEFLDCEIAIAGDIRRGARENPVEVSVANPNEFPVSLESLDLRLVAFDGQGPWALSPRGTLRLAATIDASNVKSKELRLTGSIGLRSAIGHRHTEVGMKVETTGAALADAGFEESFDP